MMTAAAIFISRIVFLTIAVKSSGYTSTCPSSPRDIVLVESIDGELCMTSAYLVIWGNLRRYRVIRKKISLDQTKASAS